MTLEVKLGPFSNTFKATAEDSIPFILYHYNTSDFTTVDINKTEIWLCGSIKKVYWICKTQIPEICFHRKKENFCLFVFLSQIFRLLCFYVFIFKGSTQAFIFEFYKLKFSISFDNKTSRRIYLDKRRVWGYAQDEYIENINVLPSKLCKNFESPSFCEVQFLSYYQISCGEHKTAGKKRQGLQDKDARVCVCGRVKKKDWKVLVLKVWKKVCGFLCLDWL